jgi:hypothetical protein
MGREGLDPSHQNPHVLASMLDAEEREYWERKEVYIETKWSSRSSTASQVVTI